ncbi:MAG: HAMP domain-containing protein [Acidipila sp.]|nr:HAMP domain-containing protein [Acidipila sp.]
MNTHSLRFRMTAWYAGLLAGFLLLFGLAVYLGLKHYLDSGLRNSLSQQTRSIAEKLLVDVDHRGEKHVADEASENYSPEINGRFLRITRADSSTLYQSSQPRDGSFDATRVPILRGPVKQEFFRDEFVGGHRLLFHTFPYTTPEGRAFWIEAGAPYHPVAELLDDLLIILAFGTPLIIAGAIAGGYWLMRRALQPVDDITQQAERITSRNLSERLSVAATGDEIERLSIALNRMIGRLDDAFQHINRFSADVSHELRTPLTILRGELESIAQRRLPPEMLEMIGSALEETERLAKIVDHLLTISRLDAGESRTLKIRLDLGQLAISTADQMRLLAEEKSISLVYEVAEGVEVEGDPARLRQVIANLVDNAIKYTAKNGQVKLHVAASGGKGILEIVDNGVGISAEALPNIFERFYRADLARTRYSSGAGLGLSIVKAICTAHDAEIKVFSTEGEGSRFRVELPLASSLSLNESRANSPRAAVSNPAQ